MHLFRTAMGDLVPGMFPVPDNPILLGTAQKVGAAALQGMSLGDLVQASFPLPQNPIRDATSLDRPKILTPADTKNALIRSLTSARTGPVSSDKGMGDASSTLQSVGAVLDNTVSVDGMDVPYWILALGGIAVYFLLFEHKSRYQKRGGGK